MSHTFPTNFSFSYQYCVNNKQQIIFELWLLCCNCRYRMSSNRNSQAQTEADPVPRIRYIQEDLSSLNPSSRRASPATSSKNQPNASTGDGFSIGPLLQTVSPTHSSIDHRTNTAPPSVSHTMEAGGCPEKGNTEDARQDSREFTATTCKGPMSTRTGLDPTNSRTQSLETESVSVENPDAGALASTRSTDRHVKVDASSRKR